MEAELGDWQAVRFRQSVLEEPVAALDEVNGCVRVLRDAACKEDQLELLAQLDQHLSHVWPEHYQHVHVFAFRVLELEDSIKFG